MTAGDIAALIGSIAGLFLVFALIVTLLSMVSTLRALRRTTDELRRSALPLVADMRATVVQANAELDKVDGLLGAAGSISTTVDSASRLAYLTVANPAVKVLAFGSGAARAARRLRRRR